MRTSGFEYFEMNAALPLTLTLSRREREQPLDTPARFFAMEQNSIVGLPA
jgi:hypothetical protein